MGHRRPQHVQWTRIFPWLCDVAQARSLAQQISKLKTNYESFQFENYSYSVNKTNISWRYQTSRFPIFYMKSIYRELITRVQCIRNLLSVSLYSIAVPLFYFVFEHVIYKKEICLTVCLLTKKWVRKTYLHVQISPEVGFVAPNLIQNGFSTFSNLDFLSWRKTKLRFMILNNSYITSSLKSHS